MTEQQLNAIISTDLEGEVFIRTYKGDGRAVACVYGDPTGLRSLAAMLNKLADLDQKPLPPGRLPDTEGVHIHVTEHNGLCEGSSQLDLGRLDAKATGDTTWYKRAEV